MSDSTFPVPRSRKALERLVRNRVQESLHLEYKDSRAVRQPPAEISKDVSSFANADGGVLIYGVMEKDHYPVAIDEGVELTHMSKERLEQVIGSNIAPRVECTIVPVALSAGRVAFVVQVSKSFRGPHQDRVTKKYYKRRNFIAEPMEDYEIADVRARSQMVPSLVRFDAELRSTNLLFLVVENIGTAAALDVTLTLDRTIPWEREEDKPRILTSGIKYFAPKARYDMFYGVAYQVLGQDARMPPEVGAVVKYRHATLGNTIIEEYNIDFRNYLGTWPATSAGVEQGKRLEKELKDIAGILGKMESSLRDLTNLVGPTGLDLSVRSMRNFRHLVERDGALEKIDPMAADPVSFIEVLGVDYDMAYRLRSHFRVARNLKGIAAIEGMTPELIGDVKRYFNVVDDSD